ncbi:MAG TPA: hypothetical protein VGE26_05560 [Sphingobacteriaceae bacterium]
MQIIKVNDPATDKEIKIEASPVRIEEQQGWSIRFEEGKEATIMTDQHGIWKEVGGTDLNPAIISVIGRAIETQLTSEGF